MKSTIVNIFIVIALLSAQISGAFASAEIPCSEEMMTDMMHGSHHMMADNASDDMDDCCNQDCCCPMAMFQIGLAPGVSYPLHDGVSPSIRSLKSNFHQVFLSAFQRPPKHTFS